MPPAIRNAVGHAADADPRHAQTGFAEFHIFHVSLLARDFVPPEFSHDRFGRAFPQAVFLLVRLRGRPYQNLVDIHVTWLPDRVSRCKGDCLSRDRQLAGGNLRNRYIYGNITLSNDKYPVDRPFQCPATFPAWDVGLVPRHA
jgi:hypothetical protein